METVTARLDIEVFVDCPKCGFLIDLMNESDTCGYPHNDTGAVIIQAVGGSDWSESHGNFEVNDVCCTQCDESFNVKKLEW